MNASLHNGVRFATLSLCLLLGAGSYRAQEGFKGGVFTRTAKKAHSTGHAPAARIPAKAVAANERGNASFDEKHFDEAIAAYQEAVNLSPRYAEAFLNLGDTFKELKRYDEAVNAYKQAIKVKPNYGDAFNGLGDAYEALGRKAESQDAHDHANSHFVAGGVMNGKAVRLVKPTYPSLARAAHVSGSVQVQVLIDETGQVIRARAISGDPLLQGVAVMAASLSTFSPTLLSGQPVKVNGIITYNFTP